MHNNNEQDIDEEDNSVEIVMSTASVRIPSLELVQQSDSAMAGQTIMAEAVLHNDGNAVENRLSAIARLSSVSAPRYDCFLASKVQINHWRVRWR